jgi:nucleoside triphosphate diphosphatase
MNDPARPTPAEIAAAGPFPRVDGVLDRSLALVEYLRAHCPWDREQTALSLVPYLLEETHEAVDAIQEADWPALEGELGDLLLNLAFQVVVGEEEGRLSRDGVVRQLEEKMIRRHPHLFGLGEKEPWETIKGREREASGAGVLEGLAKGLDPLLRAHRIQERAAGVGFDWNEARGALEKVKEELGEVEEAMASPDRDALREEMGDLLFAVVNLARLTGAHAVSSMVQANAKFRRRFQRLETLARNEDVPLPGASLEELDALWERIKAEERQEIV